MRFSLKLTASVVQHLFLSCRHVLYVNTKVLKFILSNTLSFFYFFRIKSEAFHSTHIMHICGGLGKCPHKNTKTIHYIEVLFELKWDIYSKIAYLFDKNSFMKKRVVFFYDSDTISYGYLKHL